MTSSYENLEFESDWTEMTSVHSGNLSDCLPEKSDSSHQTLQKEDNSFPPISSQDVELNSIAPTHDAIALEICRPTTANLTAASDAQSPARAETYNSECHAGCLSTISNGQIMDTEIRNLEPLGDIIEPVEQQSTDEACFSPHTPHCMRKAIPVFLFIIVFVSAVLSKFSFIVLVSNADLNRTHRHTQLTHTQLAELEANAMKHSSDYNTNYKSEMKDGLGSFNPHHTLVLLNPQAQQKEILEIRNTAVTLLLLAIVIPEVLLFIKHFIKSVFGRRQPWPNHRVRLMGLIVSGLETFGQCLLVFQVLPTMDVVRGMMLLSCIGLLPGLTKLVFGNNETGRTDSTNARCQLGAVMVQLTGPIAVLIFSYGWTSITPSVNVTITSEHRDYVFTSERSMTHYIRQAAEWSVESLDQFEMNWEVILVVLIINLSWCENFLEKNRTIRGKKLNICQLKSALQKYRQEMYTFLPLWKMILVFCFVFALVPDYRMQIRRLKLNNVTETAAELYAKKFHSENFKAKVTNIGDDLITTIREKVVLDIQALGHNGHKSMTKAIEDEMEKIYVSKDAPGLDRHPKGYLDFPTDPENNIMQALTQMYVNAYETGDEYRDYALDTLDGLANIKLFSHDTHVLFQDYRNFILNLHNPTLDAVKTPDDYDRYEFWPIITLVVASVLCSFFAKLSCKICMQISGFSAPLLLAGPATVVLLSCQCWPGFLAGNTMWICPEEDKSSGVFYITCALGTLWWISQMVIVSHIWTKNRKPCTRTDKLFLVPGFSMALVEQFLLYNRRHNDDQVLQSNEGGHIKSSIDFILL